MKKSTIYKRIRCFLMALVMLASVPFLSFSASATRYLNDSLAIIVGYISSTNPIEMNASTGWISSPAHPNADIAQAYYIRSYIDSSDSSYVGMFNNSTSTDFPKAERLASASPYYNCHSYAWYSQNTGSNRYWLNDPAPFYSGEGYVRTTTPSVGDIVCYMNGNNNLHSGIIVAKLSTSTGNLCGNYLVESKWGPSGLYRHNGYECPYTDYSDSPSSMIATSVVYYTRSSHTHNHATHTDIGNGTYHASRCSCGQVIHKPHTFSLQYGDPTDLSVSNGLLTPNYVPIYICSGCGALGAPSIA